METMTGGGACQTAGRRRQGPLEARRQPVIFFGGSSLAPSRQQTTASTVPSGQASCAARWSRPTGRPAHEPFGQQGQALLELRRKGRPAHRRQRFQGTERGLRVRDGDQRRPQLAHPDHGGEPARRQPRSVVLPIPGSPRSSSARPRPDHRSASRRWSCSGASTPAAAKRPAACAGTSSARPVRPGGAAACRTPPPVRRRAAPRPT